MSTEIIKAVRELAESKYNEGYGWQVIVECMEDSEIMEHLLFMKGNEPTAEITLEWALEEMTEFAKANTEHHDEIASTAW
jgi:hypothetical protein